MIVNMKTGKLIGGQIRAARGLLNWSALDLARASALGVNTIRRAEAASIETSLTPANELAIRRAFQAGGVEFTNGDQPGLRLIRTAAVRPEEPAHSLRVTVGAKSSRGNRKKRSPRNAD